MSIDLQAADKAARKPAGRILTIDIERLPGAAFQFEQRNSGFTPARDFLWHPRNICYAARWYGQSRMIFEAEWKGGAARRMAERSWDLYDQADAVITYNGIRFDNKHLKGAWEEHGIIAERGMPRPWKNIDLLVTVRREFGWLSKSLDEVTKLLGAPGKATHYDKWQAWAAVQGNKAEQRALREYNAGDVELTEWLYERLLPWISNHPHLGSSSEASCNRCGSTDLDLLPSRYRAVVLTYDQYRCQGCGGIVRINFNAVRVANTTGVRS